MNDSPFFLPMQRLSIFMPSRLSDDEIKLLFYARKDIFDSLIDSLSHEEKGSIPQHHLIVGQRGMGKSTLLKRLDVALRTAPLNAQFIPFSFPEEQYNIDRLSKFWLNSLDALADTLQTEGEEEKATQLDEQIADLSRLKNEQELSQKAYDLLQTTAQQLGRRPVYLLDNLNLIFERLAQIEQSKLRKLITVSDAPIFIGASADLLNGDYTAPFYDAFQVHYLYKLTFPQTLDLLRHLAEITNNPDFKNQLNQNIPRLETLHALTGGNVRTVVMLFALVSRGLSSDVFQDLEALIDQMTPLYKARFEELAPQAQVVIDAVALNWDPCNLETLRERTSLENSQLSIQLDRLGKAGWTVKLGKRKAAFYEISERFFNIWYLLRRASRRQRRDLVWLSRFLQAWFTKPELQDHAKEFTRVVNEKEKIHDLSYGLALARALGGKSGEKLKEKVYKRLLELYDGDEIKLEETMGVVMSEVKEEWVNIYKKSKAWDWFHIAWELEDDGKIEESENAYRETFKLSSENNFDWVGIANLLSSLGRNAGSKQAYQKALKIDPENTDAKEGLMILLRDKLGKLAEAKELFEELETANAELPQVVASALHEAVFAAYDQNWGQAREFWRHALMQIQETQPTEKLQNWHIAAAVTVRLGYGDKLVAMFRETGRDRVMRPLYEAIIALNIDSEEYLSTQVAAEVREVALAIFQFMKAYNQPSTDSYNA
ncbi:AAA family ATPase [Runella sp.]|uniref:AAA family ATPase n=1 Tax=Runella sp. TaxID=1960881 RepID=UPI003D127164